MAQFAQHAKHDLRPATKKGGHVVQRISIGSSNARHRRRATMA